MKYLEIIEVYLFIYLFIAKHLRSLNSLLSYIYPTTHFSLPFILFYILTRFTLHISTISSFVISCIVLSCYESFFSVVSLIPFSINININLLSFLSVIFTHYLLHITETEHILLTMRHSFVIVIVIVIVIALHINYTYTYTYNYNYNFDFIFEQSFIHQIYVNMNM